MADDEQTPEASTEPRLPAEVWGHPTNWSIDAQVATILSVHPHKLRGEERLGEGLAFSQAPGELEEIVGVLRDLSEENWATLDPQLRAEIEGQVNAVVGTIEGMLGATSADPNIHARKPELEGQFAAAREFFQTRVSPRMFKAEIRRGIEEQLGEAPPATAEGAEDLRRLMRGLQADIAQLSADREAIAKELESQKALVEATRDVTSASGAEALGTDYVAQADGHDKQCLWWGIGLAIALIVAAGAGYLVVDANRPPDDATTARIVSSITLDLLIVGLLIYVVRVASHRFSVHRHLAAVARNKASALSTFNRIVSAGTEPEARTALAAVLAQAVFTSDETGFIDASGGQVTLIERLAAPVTQRVTPPT